MCACEPGFTCTHCAGTRFDPAYPELPDPREDDERDHYGAERQEESDDAHL